MGLDVRVRIHYNTAFGETICICGGPANLGAWDPAKAFALVFTPGGFWEGTFSLPLTQPGTIRYKYILRRQDGSTSWEGGPDRVLHYVPGAMNALVLEDSWHAGDGAEYSSAFAKVVHGRPVVRGIDAAATLVKAMRAINADEQRSRHTVLVLQLRATRIDRASKFCVLGSHPALGSWDEQRAVVLDDADFPVWRAVLDLDRTPAAPKDASTPIRYKFGVYDVAAKRVLAWEEGTDRELPPPVKLEPGRVYVRTDEGFRYGGSSAGWRGAGVALPVFSLRTADGTGVGEFLDLCPFTDWARSVGLRLIQILPINDTVATHNWIDSYPYGAISVFALHPIYLRLQRMGELRDEAAAAEIAAERKRLNALDAVDYEAVMRVKSRFYKLLYDQERDRTFADPRFRAFVQENADWLLPYAAFSCLRDKFGTVDYGWWPKYGTWSAARAHFEPLMSLAEGVPHSAERDDVMVHLFIQWHTHMQMTEAAAHARALGVVLKGDLPIGVMRNSVDTWVSPHLFNLQYQTGAPPDAFSANGQNWGFPTYNWDAMARDGNYAWWKRRLGKLSSYFDAFRIDHILGFFRIWEIPGDAVDGLLGQFSPAHPISVDELHGRGLRWFDYGRFCTPYIREHMLDRYLGGAENVALAKRDYLTETAPGCYALKPFFSSQKLIVEHFAAKLAHESAEKTAQLKTLRDGLMAFTTEVIFLPARVGTNCYSPRVMMQFTQSFRDLDGDTQAALNRIYTHYFYERNEGLWEEQAWRKLPALKSATEMLVCGEDLGMVPACVPPCMARLGILSLNVQRMPKDPKEKFYHPSRASHLSVVTPSSHDTSTIRGWWEEDRNVTRDFWVDQMGRSPAEEPPVYCEPWVVTEIVNQHMYSPAMWAIFPLQDLVGMDGELRLNNPHAERINIPAIPKHYWRFRFHLSVEQLAAATKFNAFLANMISSSGRNSLF